MFVSRDLVFVELHKTGCTHVGRLLATLVAGQQIGKHNPAPLALLGSGRKFIGSIRNPWDWYVSLWAYGCEKKGAVYERTTGLAARTNAGSFADTNAITPVAAARTREWQRCYADVNSASAFRDWLNMMHDARYRHDIGEGYGASSVSRLAGLLTYRYCYLFCRPTNIIFDSIAGLQAYEKLNCYIDHFIRTEHLEEDFCRALAFAGVPLSNAQRESVLTMGKTNTSRGRKQASYYYDPSTVNLVRERERLIVDRFRYTFPLP